VTDEDRREDDKLDEELDETFPASDPPSTWAGSDADDDDQSGTSPESR
jgi:hypothetical protein